MAEDKMTFTSEALERKIITALETAPRIDIAAGFAASMARQLPPLPSVVITPARYGVRAAVACVVLLLVGMLAFAHSLTGSSLLWLSIESLVCAQFVLLTFWLVTRTYRTPGSF
jgi:hypothetical protein